MLEEIKEIQEMLKTDAEIFKNRGERVASTYASIIAREIEEILEKKRD